MTDGVAQVARWLSEADSALFVTGAGVSADSGLPTYRGVGGLYDRGPTEEGVPIEVALSGHTLRTDPALCWKYMAQIGRACEGAAPNAAHRAIAALERRLPRVWVLTQNVDGLHRAAGSTNVIEVHGGLSPLFCMDCGHAAPPGPVADLKLPPLCERCGGVLRPPVVLFGEALPDRAIATLERELALGFDVVVTIGTSAVFPYIAWPTRAARARGLPTVEINPARSEISRLVDLRLELGAAEAMAAILAAMP
ncbi:MAG: NAD-dependent deacylase [Alphaproteobacteria bacterium]|nr:NAD-dependent deacylase [Alphaproteobacteria bacterium]